MARKQPTEKQKETRAKNLAKGAATRFRAGGQRAVECGRKGAQEQHRREREHRTMRENIEMLMNMDCTFPELKKKMAALGIADEEQTNQMALALAMFGEAMRGNVKAASFLRDTKGEQPTQKQEVTGKDGEPIAVEEVITSKEEAAKVMDDWLKTI